MKWARKKVKKITAVKMQENQHGRQENPKKIGASKFHQNNKIFRQPPKLN
jgi:hypothetical protein